MAWRPRETVRHYTRSNSPRSLMIGSCARVLCSSPKVDLAEIHPRAQHRLHARDRALDPILGQPRLDLHQRGATVTAPERLHDDPSLAALHDQHAVLTAHVPDRDLGMRVDTPRHRPRLSRRDLLARDLSKVLEHRPEHVRRQALRRRAVRQLAVVEREDLPARPLHPLDHLQLDLQRAHQPIEIRHHKLVGPAGLDHLDRRQQAGALGQRQLAAHVDLGNRRGNQPLTAVLRPPPGGLDLHLGRVKVLVLPIALLAHADDHNISELRHATPLDGRLTPFRRLRPDRREGTRGQGALPRRLPRLRRANQRTRRQRRRARILQEMPSRSDRAGMDTRTGARSDARLAATLRQPTDLL